MINLKIRKIIKIYEKLILNIRFETYKKIFNKIFYIFNKKFTFLTILSKMKNGNNVGNSNFRRTKTIAIF